MPARNENEYLESQNIPCLAILRQIMLFFLEIANKVDKNASTVILRWIKLYVEQIYLHV